MTVLHSALLRTTYVCILIILGAITMACSNVVNGPMCGPVPPFSDGFLSCGYYDEMELWVSCQPQHAEAITTAVSTLACDNMASVGQTGCNNSANTVWAQKQKYKCTWDGCGVTTDGGPANDPRFGSCVSAAMTGPACP